MDFSDIRLTDKSYLIDTVTSQVWDDELGWNDKRMSIHTANEWTQIEYKNNSFITASLPDREWKGRKARAIKVYPFVDFEVLT